jgi:hypothetical protein
MATMRRLLRCLLNELNEVQVQVAHVPKPDITPSVEASRSLLQELGNRPLPVLHDMEWNYGRAMYLRHLASALYRQLGALHELDCMSVRALEPTGPSTYRLREDISKLRDFLLSFYGFAHAMRRD